MNIITKPYESLLPYLVVEAISAQGTTFNSMSVRMIDKGWAWLVCGRKLLIWKFKESKSPSAPKARRVLSPCFELQLPQSDLIHRAELIHAFFMPQNPNVSLRAITVPATLVVSPEGTIRFWSSIANERFTESSVGDMQGQEFCTLAQLSPLEYLLGTTTGMVLILSIDITAHDKSMLLCTPLNTPSGLLSGISRRVTDLFFGPLAADIGTETRRPLIAVPKYSQSTIDKTGSTDRPFFVMSSNFKLRQWSRTNEGIGSTNCLVREWDLQKGIFARLVFGLNLSTSGRLNFWPIDMVITKAKEILILVVTLDSTRDNAINYATCTFNPFQSGEDITSLTILRSHSWHYSNESEDQLMALRFLERQISSSLYFMYDRKFIFLVQADHDILDAIDYGNQDDGILGAGIVDNHPILFTQRDGLTYVVPVNSNRSRMNDTSIVLEPIRPSSTDMRPKSRSEISQRLVTSTRIDPVIIEIDVDDKMENEQLDAPNQSCLTPPETDNDNTTTTTTNKSRNQSNLNRSIDEPAKHRAEVDDIISDSKEFEWIRQIDARQYKLASETLTKLAQESEIFKDRKETLLALSTLARLAE